MITISDVKILAYRFKGAINGIWYHVALRSGNEKTGRIAVTTSSALTCPRACQLWSACYAGSGRLAMWWRKVTLGLARNATNLQGHLKAISALPAGSLIRLNQAGDLYTTMLRGLLSRSYLDDLARSCASLRAWTYTHHYARANGSLIRRNLQGLARLNRLQNGSHGLVINLSANSPAQYDRLIGYGSPVVSTTDRLDKVQSTPAGNRLILCPAQYDPHVTCGGGKVSHRVACTCCGKRTIETRSCGVGRPLCARSDRDYGIAFYVHGGNKEKAREITRAAV